MCARPGDTLSKSVLEMASTGTPLADGRSGAGLGASPGGALGSSQGVGPAGRATGPGVDQGVRPVDQGIDSGVLTSGSTVSPATHGVRFYSDQGARIGDMSGRQGPSLGTQHAGGAAGPQNTETNLMNWSPRATNTAQNQNYQGGERQPQAAIVRTIPCRGGPSHTDAAATSGSRRKPRTAARGCGSGAG